MTEPTDRVAELAAMRRLAEHGIHTRSSRQLRRGDFPDLPWVGDADASAADVGAKPLLRDACGEQLELFGDEQ